MTKNTGIPPKEILPSLFRSNMLRMILTKHIELNKAVDMKANMLMTAASIVIAVLVTGFETTDLVGAIIILITSLLAIIFAILVIMPRPYHDRTYEKTNFLYFRSFNALSEDEYVNGFKELMSNKEAMYEQYMRDIYRYGSITICKKYRLLRIGLMSFLTGLSLGGVYFLVRFL